MKAAMCALLATSAAPAAENEVVWTMINVTPTEGQADCHLLTFPRDQRVLIDAADASDAPGIATRELQRLGVEKLDLVIISHFHRDHYGRLLDILNRGIVVEHVIVNVPDRRIADRERPWGCNYDDVQAVLASLRARGVLYTTPKAGERVFEITADDGTLSGIDVLCIYDGVNTPVGETDVNDTSIVVRVFHGSTRALFTGDLNATLGAYLAQSDLDLKATLLKAPHHGTEGAAPNEFFDRVAASALLVPAPQNLWYSERSKRIRSYFLERGIPAYISGVHGHVTVTLGPDGFHVGTEHSDLGLEFEFAPQTEGVRQLFWDTGHGLNENQSAHRTRSIDPPGQATRFPLPDVPLRELRFDPHNGPFEILVSAIRIVDSKNHVVAVLPVDSLRPAQEIASCTLEGDVLKIQSIPDAKDPSLWLGPEAMTTINDAISRAKFSRSAARSAVPSL